MLVFNVGIHLSVQNITFEHNIIEWSGNEQIDWCFRHDEISIWHFEFNAIRISPLIPFGHNAMDLPWFYRGND